MFFSAQSSTFINPDYLKSTLKTKLISSEAFHGIHHYSIQVIHNINTFIFTMSLWSESLLPSPFYKWKTETWKFDIKYPVFWGDVHEIMSCFSQALSRARADYFPIHHSEESFSQFLYRSYLSPLVISGFWSLSYYFFICGFHT